VARRPKQNRAAVASLSEVIRELRAAGSPKRAAVSLWFFKTGKGQYGEGDRFLGVAVPALRRIAIRHRDLTLRDVERLLQSPIHEHRTAGFEILVAQYERGDAAQRERLYRFYLRHTRCANNWDLVDASAPYIVGEHLKTQPRGMLDTLAQSNLIWERRIAIVATLVLIRAGELNDTFRIAEVLLSDRHDLIHKAVGWMLRETGKISPDKLRKFLRRHYKRMPRTALRYAIERFPAAERRRMLAGIF
jgi:3-methyladenine DNA glycosylase AlkD